jgi:predicted RNA binding protein YcfA (HicA-like mRNA interferase family)
MPRKLRDLRRELRRAGFYVVRREGSHQTWKHDDVPEVRVILAGADGDDAHRYNERQVRDAVGAVREVQRRQRP